MKAISIAILLVLPLAIDAGTIKFVFDRSGDRSIGGRRSGRGSGGGKCGNESEAHATTDSQGRYSFRKYSRAPTRSPLARPVFPRWWCAMFACW